jgi:hypothetical protein
MTFLGSTMSALKSIIRGTSRPKNYQTLPTSDLRDGDGEIEEGRAGDHDQAVYLSFWLFGAGCLLGWNGKSSITFKRGAND